MLLTKDTKVDLQKVKYATVKQAFDSTEVIQSKDDIMAPIVWYDGFIPKIYFLNVLPHQRINKIPGMDILCYKSSTFKALNYMRAIFPKTFSFYPTTYLLPFQFCDFQREHLKIVASSGMPLTWIYKPRTGCCGNGIKLIQNSYEVAENSYSGVIQKYVPPYLLNGYKFDFRLYIFVATLEPYTVYIYNDGISRFCSSPYSPPTKETLDDKFSHLTNTAVNAVNKDTSSHELLQLASTTFEKIKSQDPRGNVLWKKIKDVARLVMLAQYNNIVDQVKMQETETKAKQKPPAVPLASVPFMKKFFHLIGIDIMLNDNCDPVILEMNDRPSLCVTFDIENEFKTNLLKDVLHLITTDGSPPPPTASFGGWEEILPIHDSNTMISKVSTFVFEKAKQYSTARLPKSKTRVFPPTYNNKNNWKQRTSVRGFRETSMLPPLKGKNQ